MDRTPWISWHNVFKGLPVSHLKAGRFYVGAAAHDGSDDIIYDAVSGTLSYDRDGLGALALRAQVKFAQQLAAHPNVDNGDFLIV